MQGSSGYPVVHYDAWVERVAVRDPTGLRGLLHWQQVLQCVVRPHRAVLSDP